MSAGEIRQLTERLLACAALEHAWETVELPAATRLFSEGDEGDALYLVIEGGLEVFHTEADGRRVLLETIGPGGCVGEVALVDGGTRSASIDTTVPTRLRRLEREAFLANLMSAPELGEMALRLVTTRMRRVMGYVALMTGWARQVAQGDYDGARRAARERAALENDADVDRFIASFNEMIAAVQERESRLRHELQDLRVEIDQQKYRRQLAEVTETEFFRDLQANARRLRGRVRGEGGGAGDAGNVSGASG